MYDHWWWLNVRRSVTTQRELPGVRCDSGTLHLDLPSAVGARLDLPQVHHRSVSQLTREQAELVAAVAVRGRLGARQQPGAAQILRAQRVTQHVLLGQAEQGQSRRGLGHDGRADQGLEGPN